MLCEVARGTSPRTQLRRAQPPRRHGRCGAARSPPPSPVSSHAEKSRGGREMDKARVFSTSKQAFFRSRRSAPSVSIQRQGLMRERCWTLGVLLGWIWRWASAYVRICLAICWAADVFLFIFNAFYGFMLFLLCFQFCALFLNSESDCLKYYQ
jgi:hypothetical protein